MQQATLIDGRYSLLRLLGSGGMGCVHLARDESLRREVALKVLHEHYAKNDEFVERFRREAKHAGALSHPNIVAVYDFGVVEDTSPYIAMEYVPGGTLKDEISRRGTLVPEEAAGVALQMANALGWAHRNGIIHRDVKPENVLLEEDGSDEERVGGAEGKARDYHVKVTDFGIAKAAAEATAVTQNSMMLGTVHYLSPEQASGGEVGFASDLYSLGVVLFEMLTGRPPFEAEGPIAVAMKHITEAPPSPHSSNPRVPECLAAITMRLLAKDPTVRHASAEELAEDLGRVLDGRQPAPVPIGPLESVTEALPAAGGPPDGRFGSRSGGRPDRVYRSGFRWRRWGGPWVRRAIAAGCGAVVLLSAGLFAVGLPAGASSSSLGQEIGMVLGYDSTSGKSTTVVAVSLPASEGMPAAPKAPKEPPSNPADASADSVKTPAMATSSSSASASATASATASASSATPAADAAPPNESTDDTAEVPEALSPTSRTHAAGSATSESEQESPQGSGPAPARPSSAAHSNAPSSGAPSAGGAKPTPIQPVKPVKIPPPHIPKIEKP
jgi:serine/threonine protein kinase